MNREFALIHRVFNVAIHDGKTERNPVAKLGMLREPSERVRYLTDDEEKALACFRDHRGVLAPGERGVVMVLAADRRQAANVLGYIVGFLDAVPMLGRLIERRTAEARVPHEPHRH